MGRYLKSLKQKPGSPGSPFLRASSQRLPLNGLAGDAVRRLRSASQGIGRLQVLCRSVSYKTACRAAADTGIDVKLRNSTTPISLVSIARAAVLVSLSMTTGDAICQFLEVGAEHEWDSRRSMTFGICGLLATGPAGQCWNFFIETCFPGTAARAVAWKTCANAGWALFFTLPATFTFVTLLSDGGTPALALRKIEDNLFKVWMAGNLYMPLVHVIVFKTVSVEHRQVITEIFRVLWNMYLSYNLNSK